MFIVCAKKWGEKKKELLLPETIFLKATNFNDQV